MCVPKIIEIELGLTKLLQKTMVQFFWNTVKLAFVHICTLQIKNGFQFESETDTEIIPKLLKMINDTHKDDDLSFRELVERAVQQLVSCCLLATCILGCVICGLLRSVFLCITWLHVSSLCKHS